MRYDRRVNRFSDGEKTVTLAKIAIPKLFEMIFITVITTVNTLMLSAYDETAVAATSVAGTVVSIAVNLFSMACVGTSVVMSTELGRQNRAGASRVAGSGFFLTAAISLLVGLSVMLFSDGLMGMMDLAPESAVIAAEFLRIKAGFLIVTALGSFFNTLLICSGRALWAMISGVASNLLNVVFGYLVLYSGISFPVSGANGIAIASILAQGGGLAVSLVAYLATKCPLRLVFVPGDSLRILRIGVPAGMAVLSFSLAGFVSTRFITGLGTDAINAKVYVQNIVSYTYLIGYAIAQGTGILIGRFRGKGDMDAIKTLYRQNLPLAVGANLLLSALVLLLHRPLLSLFTDSPAILAMAAVLMAVDILVEVGRAVNHVSEQALNANGDSIVCLITSVASCWGGSILFGFLLSVVAGMGVWGIWIAYAVNELFKAVVYLLRWRSGKWQKKRI